MSDTTAPPPADPSFLDRKRWGLPHWLLIAMAVIFVLGFVPRGVRKGLETNVNKAEDWLPKDYPESTDLRWFAQHFVGAKFVLVSWDGCTLAEDETIALVVDQLNREKDDLGQPLFTRILTGPDQIASLTEEPSNLTRVAAIRRLEGALVGPPTVDAESLAELDLNADEVRSRIDQSRVTCSLAYLNKYVTDNNVRMRKAVERISEVVEEVVGIQADAVHLGGPPVDNVTIDIEGEKTLLRLAAFSGIVGFALSFWCFRSVRLTWFVFSVSGISAGVSLAIVYWYGVAEINLLGYEAKHLGTVDAILMSMPAVVYVLGLSGAIHIVNYYRDERDARGVTGAAERGVKIGFGPCALAALTTAVGLGSLGTSEIVPIRKFGVFSAAGVLATVGVLITILPICLHLFPPKLPGDKKPKKPKRQHGGALPPWAASFAAFVTQRHNLTAVACIAAMGCFAYGLTKTDSEVRLLKLLDRDTKLIHDYAWFESNLGNLVPMELIVTLGAEHRRGPEERSDDGPTYRMTMYERLRMVERIQQRIEALPQVSRAMSAATFGPEERETNNGIERRATDFTISKALEENREALAEYLVTEKPREGLATDPRELWRVSARVAALGDGQGGEMDYGLFVVDLQEQVEPVLDVYRLRDKLTATLHEAKKSLVGSRIAVVVDTPAADAASSDSQSIDAQPIDAQAATPSDDEILYEVLRESGVTWRRGKLAKIALDKLTDPGDKRDAYRKTLASLDAVVTLSPEGAAAVKEIAGDDATLVTLPTPGAETAERRAELMVASTTDASLTACYTGIVPLVYKTQRELLTSLGVSIAYATLLIACVMVVVLRSPGGGIVSMIPNLFPVVTVFGSLGWLGIKIDIGIMMTASVALGVAVDDTIHFLTWFRRGIVRGMDRRSATMLAFDRCAVAMTQTTLIAGLGLAVFATSTFTPTQEFGCLMITMLGAALVGDLVMLPAILCGPLGRFFAPGAAARPEDVTGIEASVLAEPQTAEPQIAKAESAEPQTDEAEPAQVEAPVVTPAKPATNGVAPPEPLAEPAGEPADQPVGVTPHSSLPEDELSPANAALRAKLQKFRRA
ncbi:MAG: MMPL family transporter [Planctomycetota bacterium]